MNIELSALEDRAEDEENMAEALRFLNAAIRRVHRSGLLVQAEILTMHSPGGSVPQVDLATLDRQYGAI
jgi:hypothetical protein